MKNIVLKNAIIVDPSQKINNKGSLRQTRRSWFKKNIVKEDHKWGVWSFKTKTKNKKDYVE